MRVTVHLSPRAQCTRVGGRYGDADPPILVVRVTAPAADGKANAAAIEAMAQALDLPRGSVRIVAGKRARTKIIELDTDDADAVAALLARYPAVQLGGARRLPWEGKLRVGITGHRGLSEQTTSLITEGLHQVLDELDGDVVGVSLLADGPDSIFADEVLHHGGQLHVVVPANRYRDELPAEQHPIYDRLLARATNVQRLDYTDSTEDAHMAGSEAMLESIDLLLAIWDGQPARGYGGTADVVHAAYDRDIPVRVLWPEGATRD